MARNNGVIGTTLTPDIPSITLPGQSAALTCAVNATVTNKLDIGNATAELQEITANSLNNANSEYTVGALATGTFSVTIQKPGTVS